MTYHAVYKLKKDGKEHSRNVFVRADDIFAAVKKLKEDTTCSGTLKNKQASLVMISENDAYIIS